MEWLNRVAARQWLFDTSVKLKKTKPSTLEPKGFNHAINDCELVSAGKGSGGH